MREILFRGKHIHLFPQNEHLNGTWVYGYLCDKNYINSPELNGELLVDPSTVGQYTGLTDKNGNRVFDGDILHIAKIADGLGSYYQPPLDYPVNVVVKWGLCAWMWETLCEDKRYISFPDAWCNYECEVIGNITDNPELLEK